ncbi:beta/gamma crystallin-related protein [Sphingoaurantiacus capsulatus]|uniref:Beta/gamma crystallin-related protein n=1 Tax=Sphingoaurantiacus capsulatus TaxID=1771310 RepID=A0ABV7XEU8_9SPHN
MRILILAAAAVALPLGAASAQTATSGASITLYELPGFLGRSVTITGSTADLTTQGFARRAQSARVVGEWEICGATSFGGTCQTLAANTPYLKRSGIVSLRPTGSSLDDEFNSGTGVNLDDMDPGDGTSGQDVTFYPRPTLGDVQVSAGTNDLTSAGAFCQRAGFSGAAYAARARVQASNIVDAQRGTRVRAFPLRDVLCKR